MNTPPIIGSEQVANAEMENKLKIWKVLSDACILELQKNDATLDDAVNGLKLTLNRLTTVGNMALKPEKEKLYNEKMSSILLRYEK